MKTVMMVTLRLTIDHSPDERQKARSILNNALQDLKVYADMKSATRSPSTIVDDYWMPGGEEQDD